MKRFLRFDFDDYRSQGGWNDLVGSFDTLEEAKAEAPKYDNAEIIDSTTGTEVAFWSNPVSGWEVSG